VGPVSRVALNLACFGPQRDPAAALKAAAWAGFGAAEIWLDDVPAAAAMPEMAILNIQPLHDLDAGLGGQVPNPAAARRKKMEALRYLGEARHVSARAVLVCLPMDPVTEPRLIRELTRSLARRAAHDDPRKPVQLWVEALSFGTDFSTPLAAWNVVRDVGLDNVRLMFDAWHWLARGGKLRDLDRINWPQVACVQLSDARKRPGRANLIDEARHFRVPHGGIWDAQIRALIAYLKARHWDGEWSLEVFSDELAALPPEDTAERLRDAVKALGL